MVDEPEAMRQFAEAYDKVKKEYVDKARKLVELSLDLGVMITLTDEQLRAIGKTTLLLEKAQEIGAVYVTGNRHVYEMVQEIYEDKIAVFLVNSSNISDYKGQRFYGGFIVDECVPKSFVELLKNSPNAKIVGGIRRL